MADARSSLRTWPALTYEERAWKPVAEGISRREFRAHSGPYRAAIAPQIADADPLLSPVIQSVAEEAAAELARTDATLARSGVGPLPAVLLRTESSSSSQIERLTASARALADAELGEVAGGNAQLVVANVRAMERALANEGRITLEAVLGVHATLIEPDPDHDPGLREEQVWIGGKRTGPHLAKYIAPHHERVPASVTDLLEFTQRVDLPVVVHTAITHAHFETIHPFTDGNGRAGRALIHMMLREAGLTRGAAIPVSAGLLHETEAYIDALTAYRDGDPEPIVERVAEASLFACALALDLNDSLTHMAHTWRANIRARRGASVWTLMDLLPRHPVVTAELVQERLAVSAPTAYAAIDRLVEAGILTPRNSGRRNRVWDASEVLKALDRFAEGARRG